MLKLGCYLILSVIFDILFAFPLENNSTFPQHQNSTIEGNSTHYNQPTRFYRSTFSGVPPGKPCSYSSECLAGRPYSRCGRIGPEDTSGRVCHCLYGNVDLDGNCPDVPTVVPCNDTDDCVASVWGNLAKCQKSGSKYPSVCACLFGHSDISRHMCLGYKLGDPCNSNRQCPIIHSHCNDTRMQSTAGTCVCKYEGGMADFCFPKIDLPFKFPSLDTPSVPHVPSYNYDSPSAGSRSSKSLSTSDIAKIIGTLLLAFIAVYALIKCKEAMRKTSGNIQNTPASAEPLTSTTPQTNAWPPIRTLSPTRALPDSTAPPWTTGEDQELENPPSYNDVMKQDSSLHANGNAWNPESQNLLKTFDQENARDGPWQPGLSQLRHKHQEI